MIQIRPVSDLRNKFPDIERLVNEGEPVYLTKNGYGDMVIMGMEVYERTMRQLAVYRDVEVSEQQIETGHTKDAWTALSGMRKKYGL